MGQTAALRQVPLGYTPFVYLGLAGQAGQVHTCTRGFFDRCAMRRSRNLDLPKERNCGTMSNSSAGNLSRPYHTDEFLIMRALSAPVLLFLQFTCPVYLRMKVQ